MDSEPPEPTETRPDRPAALAALETGETLPALADTVAATPAPDELREAAQGARGPASFEARYRRDALLGEGGMGEVALARDRWIGRDVAVKTMRPEIGRRGEERFLREARVQAQLEHPAIVPVYDIGVSADGRAYFTMKRIGGRSLASILSALRDGDPETTAHFTRRRLITAFLQVCFALEYAHDRGVLHRDLKPANVMIGDFGEVHVIDWGLAKLRGGPDDEDALSLPASSEDGQTQAGATLGTPGYMAPEQALGRIEQVDERSDVYALGVMLFELLFLEPFHGQRSVTARLAATVTAVDPPIAERERYDDVPPELVAVVERATAVDLEARLSSARVMAAEVERYLDGERDESRRRELAAQHVEAAHSLAGDPARRVDALRELGRALALDPTHADALRSLEQLLSSLPDEVPEGAREELAQREGTRRRSVLRASAVRSMAWLLAIPVVIAFGIRDWSLAWVAIGFLVANVVVSTAVAARANAASDRALLTVLVVSSLCIASFSLIMGPLVLVPGFAATNAMMFALTAGPRLRRVAIGASIAALAVPMGAAALGLGASYYTSGPAASIVVTSPVTALPLPGTLVFLLVALAALMVTPTVLAGQLQDRLAEAERRVFLQAFHLRQLLPRDEAEPV